MVVPIVVPIAVFLRNIFFCKKLRIVFCNRPFGRSGEDWKIVVKRAFLRRKDYNRCAARPTDSLRSSCVAPKCNRTSGIFIRKALFLTNDCCERAPYIKRENTLGWGISKIS
jgi:hypothetical protein